MFISNDITMDNLFHQSVSESDWLTAHIGAVGSRAASFKRPLLSIEVSIYVCLSVHNFDAKYLGNYAI